MSLSKPEAPGDASCATAANEVLATLASHGRHIEPERVHRELSGLDGLDGGAAGTTLLNTYGIDAHGQPTPAFVADHQPRRAVSRVLRIGRPAVSYTLVAAVFGIVPALMVPLLMRLFVDRYLVAGDATWIVPVVVGLVGAAIAATSLVWLQYSILRRSFLRLSSMDQVGFAWHLLRMRVSDLTSFSPGDIISRMAARQRVAFQGGMLLPLAAVNIVNALTFAAALLILDGWMFATTMAIGLLTFGASLLVLLVRDRKQVRADESLAALSGTTSDTIGAIESVKAAAWEQFAFARWSRVRQRMAWSLTNLGIANQWLVLIPAVALAAGLGCVLAVGALQVIAGSLSLGTLVAGQAFVAMFLESLGMLVYLGVLYQGVTSASAQADAVLRAPLDPEVVPQPDSASMERLRGEVALCDMTFGYDPGRAPLIDRLDITVAAGSRVALVGSSGSGKTTIAKLVMGELRPWSGRVELDGVPRLRVPREVRTSGMAYVPQHPLLFAGTIRDNLTLWDESISDGQLRRAAAAACIDDAILLRPGGYYASVSSADGGFSGGEIQRLAIARALVGEPAVLILDEATSALDPVVEVEVERNLRQLGCTCLVVAHRLSTIRDADEILVIDNGSVAQRGTFDELKDEGLFAELING